MISSTPSETTFPEGKSRLVPRILEPVEPGSLKRLAPALVGPRWGQGPNPPIGGWPWPLAPRGLRRTDLVPERAGKERRENLGSSAGNLGPPSGSFGQFLGILVGIFRPFFRAWILSISTPP